MASLKSFTDDLAGILGTSAALLYERQRALVRDSILVPEREGRGPGNGVVATPTSVALLLIAALSGNDLEGTSQRTAKLCIASNGKRQFKGALVCLLSEPDARKTLKGIKISQSSAWAQIHFARRRNLTVSETFTTGEKRQPPVRIVSEVDGVVFDKIALWLAAAKEV